MTFQSWRPEIPAVRRVKSVIEANFLVLALTEPHI